jgi:hypothetical protein
MNAEYLVECELAGETEIVGEKLIYCHFLHDEHHMTWPEIEPVLLNVFRQQTI